MAHHLPLAQEFLQSRSTAIHILGLDKEPFFPEKIPDLSVIQLSDSLGYGPSRFFPTDHRIERIKYWSEWYAGRNRKLSKRDRIRVGEGVISADDLGVKLEKLSNFSKGVVVWCRPSNSLPVIWCLHAFHHLKMDVSRVEFAWVVAGIGDEWRLDLVMPQRVSPEMMNAGLALWEQFTCGSMRSFATACHDFAHAVPGARNLVPKIMEYCPRLEAGRIQLSLFDNFVFSGLSRTDWITLVELRPLMWTTASQETWSSRERAHRLLQWCDHCPTDCPIEFKLQFPGDNAHWSQMYRLTDVGYDLLIDGTSDPQLIPSIQIGGFHLGG